MDLSSLQREAILGSLQDVGEQEGPQRLDAALLQQHPLPDHRLHHRRSRLEQDVVHLTGLWGGGRTRRRTATRS